MTVSMTVHVARKSLLAAMAVASLSACGSKSTIDLQAQPKPPVSKPASAEKPSPGNPADPNNSASNPEKPAPPVGPARARYRLVCEAQQAVAPFTTLETTTKSFEGALILFLGSYTDPGEVVTRDHKNIVAGVNPVTVAGALTDQLDFLFVGQKQLDRNGTLSDPRLFLSNTDAVLRTGKAIDLGVAAPLDKSIRQLADTIGIAAANYGASDLGHYVLVPVAGGFKVTTRDLAKNLGTIAADSSKTIQPKIFENQKLFTALTFNGRTFVPVVQKLSFAPARVDVVSSVDVGTATGSAASIQAYDATSIVWSETSPLGTSSIVVAKYDSSTNKLTRALYRTSVPGAKIYPQVAVIKEDGTVPFVVNVAVEAVRPSTDALSAVISYAKVQQLILAASGTSLSEGDAIDYPASAISKVQSLGLAGSWIVKTLFATSNSDELIGTFDARNGHQIFKDRGGYFDGVSEADCNHPSVVEENL